jgi:YaiO family outer membrane protein
LSWSGQHEAAISQYDRLLKSSPNNADFLLGKASVLFWQGNTEQAISTTRRARDISADYTDVWLSELKFLASDEKYARDYHAVREDMRLRFPSLVLPPLPHYFQQQGKNKQVWRWRADAGYIRETLDIDSPDWHNRYASISSSGSAGIAYAAGVEKVKRYNIDDQQLNLAAYYTHEDGVSFVITGSYSDTYTLLPKHSLGLEAHGLRYQQWLFNSGIKHTVYPLTNNQTLTLGVSRRLWLFNLGYEFKPALVEGKANVYGHKLYADHYYGTRNHLGISFSKGEELESDGKTFSALYQTQTLSINGKHFIRPKWAMTYGLMTHQQDNLHQRNGFQLGLIYQQ